MHYTEIAEELSARNLMSYNAAIAALVAAGWTAPGHHTIGKLAGEHSLRVLDGAHRDNILTIIDNYQGTELLV